MLAIYSLSKTRARMMKETKLPAQYALLEALQRTDQELLKQLLEMINI